MARPSPYSESQKAAIIEAIKTSRKGGKKWPEILEAAKAKGFKGGLPYLMKFAKAAGAVRSRRRKGGRPKAIKAGGKRGRPARAAVAGNGAGLGAIDAIVARMVEQRVSMSIGRAIKALEVAVVGLKSL